MIFRQITHDDLGCASYLIGDQHAGVAAVVDPKLDVEEYLALARYMGVSIEHVLETHNHADHVSGHGRLASATGSAIHVHRAADPSYEHDFGVAVGQEFAGKGVNVSLGPTINLVRDPRWGRSYETFGEDPYLTGEIVSADVQGMQSQGVMAEGKHAEQKEKTEASS